MTEQVTGAAMAANAIPNLGSLHEVPLTLRHQLTNDARLLSRKPLRVTFPMHDQIVSAEILYGRNGSCIFFRADLGALPYTAQSPEARQQILDLMHALRRDADYLAGDITLLKNPATGLLAIRSSAVLQGKPAMTDLFNELAHFAQVARPYFELLRPLLGQSA